MFTYQTLKEYLFRLDPETAQGAGMAVVALFTVQLPPEFRTGYVGRTPDKISDPLDFLRGRLS